MEWSVRYLPDFRLPDKALDLVDQACAAVRFRTLTPGGRKDSGGEPASRKLRRPGTPPERPGAGRSSHGASHNPSNLVVGREEIAEAVAARCGVPVGGLKSALHDGERLMVLEEDLGRRVKGQPEAIAAVAEAVRLARAGLKKPGRPVGVYLFVGPSGTGKTELAKALAKNLFDDERRLIRFDMSEFMEEHSVSKLAGLNARLAERGVSLELDASAVDLILREGFSEEFGARHLERTLDELLGKPLAEGLLSGHFAMWETVRVVAEEGHLRLFVGSTSE